MRTAAALLILGAVLVGCSSGSDDADGAPAPTTIEAAAATSPPAPTTAAATTTTTTTNAPATTLPASTTTTATTAAMEPLTGAEIATKEWLSIDASERGEFCVAFWTFGEAMVPVARATGLPDPEGQVALFIAECEALVSPMEQIAMRGWTEDFTEAQRSETCNGYYEDIAAGSTDWSIRQEILDNDGHSYEAAEALVRLFRRQC